VPKSFIGLGPDSKRPKTTDSLNVILTLLGSGIEKAAHITLMKLAQGVDFISLSLQELAHGIWHKIS